MLWSGIVLGTIMFIAFAGIWIKFPWWLKLITLWSPLTTDVLLTITVVIITAGVSSSITGLTAGMWAGLLFSVSLVLGEIPLRRYALYEGAKKDSWLAKKLGVNIRNNNGP